MNISFQKTHQRAFGTFPLKGEILAQAIAAAAAVGYRAFDTAQMYGNEADTGAALKATGMARDELCITTKVQPENYGDDRFIASVEQSLTDLQIDQVDILLLHWPAPEGDLVPSLRLLQQAQELGLARNIGISNFTAAMMRQARAVVDVPLVTNQVEFQPLLDQDILLAAAVETGIPLSSYCSVARGEVFKYPLFGEIGAGYGKSAAQVVLRWILQKGVAINTMSTKPANIAENFEVMDFTLSSIDMARIEAMKAVGFRVVTKELVSIAPEWD
ncbi:MAG: oxidoreductase [Cypionkella sp.]|uniref:aldo/keto reductase n=1 Tax=Cypionkella sp. TaxID=2811411 RepID=UPI0026247EDC|nr:aldo/keto reductase [Cypionkella sp.]MDB5661524.1 oxidoreductase [Cypionkella sp.]